MAFSYKSKHVSPFQLSNPTESYLPKINENMCLYKDLYLSVESSFICNSQNLETTQVSINRWMDTCSDSYFERCWTVKRNELTDASNNMYKPPQLYAEWKKAFNKIVHTVWFHFMKFWNRHIWSTMGGNQSGHLEGGGGGHQGRATVNLLSDNVIYFVRGFGSKSECICQILELLG